jgi:hypothetical protein
MRWGCGVDGDAMMRLMIATSSLTAGHAVRGRPDANRLFLAIQWHAHEAQNTAVWAVGSVHRTSPFYERFVNELLPQCSLKISVPFSIWLMNFRYSQNMSSRTRSPISVRGWIVTRRRRKSRFVIVSVFVWHLSHFSSMFILISSARFEFIFIA